MTFRTFSYAVLYPRCIRGVHGCGVSSEFVASFAGVIEKRAESRYNYCLCVRLEWLCTLTQNVPRAPHALFRGRPQASARRSLSNPEEPTVRS